MGTALLNSLKDLVGNASLLTGEADLMAYSYDAALDRSKPEAVVLAETTEQVSKVVQFCHEHGIPYVARGAGTNLSGGCIPLGGGIVISLVNLSRILEINSSLGYSLVEPGVINFHLQKELEPYGFFYAPDPASFKVCTLGGNVAENAGGPRCLKYGVTSNHVLGLEVVWPGGEVSWIDAQDPGPDLVGLQVGSEGTLGIVTKIKVKILPSAFAVKTVLVSFPSVELAIQCVSEIIAAGILPKALEAMDRRTVRAVQGYLHAGYPDDEAVLLIEVDGDPLRLEFEISQIEAICRKNECALYSLAQNEQERERLWEGRRGAYAAMARLAPNVLLEDGVVPRSMLPQALGRIRQIAKEGHLDVALLFHAGDGNLHPSILFDERDQKKTQEVKKAGFEILKACVELGGSISGEHGIGTDKREAMKWLFSTQTLSLFRRIKKALDPENLCNPGKILPTSEVPIEGGSARKVSHRMDGVLYKLDRPNFTLTVNANANVGSLKAELAKENISVPLVGEGTITQALESRAWLGHRDHVLGLKARLTSGEVIECGGRVMKNVAGYDITKLLLGSRGYLGQILEATLKVYPHSVELPLSVAAPAKFLPNRWHEKVKKAFDG